jgi:hypothetical protein
LGQYMDGFRCVSGVQQAGDAGLIQGREIGDPSEKRSLGKAISAAA